MTVLIDYTKGFFETTEGDGVGTNPATIGDPNFANVTLLLHGDGTSGSTTITDSSSSPKTITVNGNAQIDTAVKKFGTGSIEFDGTGDYIQLPYSDLINNFSDENFTIECWVYPTRSGQGFGDYIFGDVDSSGNNTTGTIQALFDSSNQFKTYVILNNTLNTITGTAKSLNSWYHYAIVRNGTDISMYINGTKEGTSLTTSTAVDTTTIGMAVGGPGDYAGLYLQGYIDEFRITKGVARYTSNFTAPTAAFSDQGPTISATTGNVFNHAPSADVAYTFSNPPTTGSAYDFTLKVAPTATVAITWPSSVKWAGGTAPSAPASGQKDVYNFFTLDGGTTYYGFQAGDAMA